MPWMWVSRLRTVDTLWLSVLVFIQADERRNRSILAYTFQPTVGDVIRIAKFGTASAAAAAAAVDPIKTVATMTVPVSDC